MIHRWPQLRLLLLLLLTFLTTARLFVGRSRPVPVDRTVAEVEGILEDLIERYRMAVSQPPPCVLGERNEESLALHRLGRLLMQVYPESMEELLIPRARDSSRPLHARTLCIALLGDLSRSGRSNIEATLHELARTGDRYLGGIALRELSSTDSTGRHLALYRSKCHADVWPAFEALPFWDDPETVLDLERIVTASPSNNHPESTRRLNAMEALWKLRILSSEECDGALERILEGSSGHDERLNWAVEVAKRRFLPYALPALRRQLDEIEIPMPPDASEEDKREFSRMKSPWREELAAGHPLPGRYDSNYDDMLIAYAELGGKLNEIERQRLTVFGYVGDPRKRLEELLKAGR